MRFFTLFVALLVSFFAGFGCNPSSPETTPDGLEAEPPSSASAAEDDPAPEGDIQRPLLWEVQGEGGPVWLFGTIHGGVDANDFDALPAALQEAIEASELVVLEVDMNDFQFGALASRALLQGDKSLSELLGAERWEKLATLVPLPVGQLEQFQPWIVYSLILQSMIGEIEAVDTAIVNHARARDKELAYLESVNEQIDYLARSITVEVLGEMIDDPQASQEQLDELISAYKSGDPDALEAIMFDEEEMQKHPEMFDALLNERNHNWLPHVKEYLQRGNVLVAVGAGHLVGEEGLVNLLRDQGYQVDRK